MTGWIILGVVILALFLLSLVRLGAEARYGESGFTVRVRLGPVWVTLLPRKKKPKQAKKTKTGSKKKDGLQKKEQKGKGIKPSAASQKPKAGDRESSPQKTTAPKKETVRKISSAPPKDTAPKKSEEPKESEKKQGGLPLPLMDLISLGIDGAGQLLARLQIDTLEIEYTIGGKTDPAGAAMQYGLLCAGGGAIVPLLENTFYRVKQRELRAWVSFETDELLIWLRLALSIRVGQLLAIGLRLGWAFLCAYRNYQEGKDNGTEASD